jgi:hypothetical protein
METEKVNRCITKGDAPYCEHKDDCIYWKEPAYSSMDFCRFEAKSMYCVHMKAIKNSLAQDEQADKLYKNCGHPSPPPIRVLNEDGSPGKDEVSEQTAARIRGRAFQMNLEAERLTDPRRNGRWR